MTEPLLTENHQLNVFFLFRWRHFLSRSADMCPTCQAVVIKTNQKCLEGILFSVRSLVILLPVESSVKLSSYASIAKVLSLGRMWSSWVMCTSAFTNAHEGSSSPHAHARAAEIYSRDLDYFRAVPTPDFHRCCHILPLSSYLGGDTITPIYSGQVAFSFRNTWNTYGAYVQIVFSPQVNLDSVALFNDSHAFIFNLGSHSTLWCQWPSTQIMKSVCETVTGKCKPKLGSDVDYGAPGQTDRAFSHQPGLGHLEVTPSVSWSFKCLSIEREISN